jgi:hypothetical protein
MPYSVEEFKRLGLYVEKAESSYVEDFELGEDRSRDLSLTLRKQLSSVSDREKENPSEVDYGVMCSLFREKLTPQDALATFRSSRRGVDALQRKNGSGDDYMQRTLKRAKAEVDAAKNMSIDFGKEPDRKALHLTKSGIIEERLHLIEAGKTEWLWRPYIPSGTITILAGDPGVGKSQVAIDLCSRVSRGAIMPGSEQRTQSMGNCAIATAEDSTKNTIVPRVTAADGNLKKIRIIHAVQLDGKEQIFSLPRDLKFLHDYIVDVGLRVLVIDPMNAFLGGDTDTYKDHDVRRALSPIENIAQRTGCAILIIAHLNKKEDSATLYRVGGSIGIVGAARSVLAVSRSSTDDEMQILYSLKSNLSKRPPALQYKLIPNDKLDTTSVKWHGLSTFDPGRVGKDDGPQRMKECFDFLRSELCDGQVAAVDIASNAKKVGIPWRTLNLYKPILGVGSEKHRGQWYWTPPAKWRLK